MENFERQTEAMDILRLVGKADEMLRFKNEDIERSFPGTDADGDGFNALPSRC